ncbi:MAG: Oxygen-independent coproporphyrinogen III oxidase [candidate division TM6 bacterium GW2011_GWF2_38_10]|nr:MAG: Oxygen-independent coproporphyrinogen III oxidase [candidate division TM6 bacterium GW2011_GWF2_38_10]
MIDYDYHAQTKSLYIHWPFCAQKCHFCDFISFENHENWQQEYLETLCTEITQFAIQHQQAGNTPIETIFIGGGTPSLCPPHLLTKLFTTLYDSFTIAPNHEITIEANPTDICHDTLQLWKSLGINRLSLGVQILNDAVLQGLNRRQRTTDVVTAVELIPSFFSNFSVDLMIGLPGISSSEWFSTLATVTSWPITHISVYLLTIYEKTPLFFQLQQQALSVWTEDEFADHYEASVAFLEENNFNQYEISNFSLKNFESKHNIAYWDRLPYRGFGVSAASFDGSCRFINEKNLSKYFKKVTLNKEIPTQTTERLSQEQHNLETIMLSLRQTKGLNLQRMLYLVKDQQKQQQLETTIDMLAQQNLLTQKNNIIKLTPKGMALENEVILKLL